LNRIFTLAAAAAAAVLISCESSTDPAKPAAFSFQVRVEDPSGAPVEGLRVSGWNDIKGYPPIMSAAPEHTARPMATTSIRAAVTVKSHVNLSVFDFENELVATLIDTIIKAGLYTFVWGPRGDVPGGVYRCRMTASDTLTSETLYQAEIYPVKHEFDPDRSIFGFTDAVGVFSTTNRLLFPYAIPNLPELDLVAETGDDLGRLEYDNTATIVVTDTSASRSQTKTVTLSTSMNRVTIVWDPPVRDGAVTGTASNASSANPAHKIDVPIPPTQWKLGPNYPNPFN
jgi:hypothetical protein